jgi:hypothetical protein
LKKKTFVYLTFFPLFCFAPHKKLLLSDDSNEQLFKTKKFGIKIPFSSFMVATAESRLKVKWVNVYIRERILINFIKTHYDAVFSSRKMLNFVEVFH